MNKWEHTFSCRNCMNLEEIDGDTYCIHIKNGIKVIHADDDYKVRCDKYEPAQLRMELGREKR